MKRVIFLLSTIISINSFAASGKYYFCKQASDFKLDDIYLLSISSDELSRADYLSKYFAWNLLGKPVDQGSWESTLSWTPFADYTYRFRIFMIPGELNYGCELANSVPQNIKKLGDAIKPDSQF